MGEEKGNGAGLHFKLDGQSSVEGVSGLANAGDDGRHRTPFQRPYHRTTPGFPSGLFRLLGFQIAQRHGRNMATFVW